MEDNIKGFWEEFLHVTNRDANTTYIECFYFGMCREDATELLDLVISGKKRATSSCLLAWRASNQNPPENGDLSIVTDWDGNPRCVIETEKVSIIPFGEINSSYFDLEGEDDTLESWRSNHKLFFEAEGKKLGYDFSWDVPVVFEEFKVVYVK